MARQVIFILLFCCGLAHANQSTPWIDQFWKQTKSKLHKQKIPGFSLAYVETAQEPKFYNFGVTEKNGQAVTQQTLFRLASVSKTFTGNLTAKLVQQSQLEWEQSLAGLAPEFPFSKNNREITLHHLLSQSSGLMPNSYDNLIEANYSLKRIINNLADLNPLCPPGECYTYQNALFGVLEYHFQKTGSSYSEQLQQELLQPLNMSNTTVGKASLVNAQEWAKPHVLLRSNKWKKTKVQETYYRVSPAAGVNSTSEDMAVWVNAMLGNYPDVMDDELLSEITQPLTKTTRELRRRAWKSLLDNAHYGLGWRVYDLDGVKIAYHSGWVKGYRAEVAVSKDLGVGIVMLMNAEANLMNQLGADFWKGYLKNRI